MKMTIDIPLSFEIEYELLEDGFCIMELITKDPFNNITTKKILLTYLKLIEEFMNNPNVQTLENLNTTSLDKILYLLSKEDRYEMIEKQSSLVTYIEAGKMIPWEKIVNYKELVSNIKIQGYQLVKIINYYEHKQQNQDQYLLDINNKVLYMPILIRFSKNDEIYDNSLNLEPKKLFISNRKNKLINEETNIEEEIIIRLIELQNKEKVFSLESFNSFLNYYLDNPNQMLNGSEIIFKKRKANKVSGLISYLFENDAKIEVNNLPQLIINNKENIENFHKIALAIRNKDRFMKISLKEVKIITEMITLFSENIYEKMGIDFHYLCKSIYQENKELVYESINNFLLERKLEENLEKKTSIKKNKI